MDLDASRGLRLAAGRARRLIELLIVLALVAIVACTLWGVFDPHAVSEMLRAQGATAAEGMADWQARALDALLVVQLGAWTGALLALRGVFLGMHEAPPFPDAAVRSARNAYRWILAGFLISLLTAPIGSVLGTWHMPPGERSLSIQFGTGHALTLVVLALTAIMSRAFALAAELWRDHQEIV
ncbi:MAG: hypothetical protein V2J24_02830 [Pseudomonadales bacterium]|jgi:hypothetical protein|nr:hypothetical protein [Pseudomonadales bacterium]